jgi:hypothetical protein
MYQLERKYKFTSIDNFLSTQVNNRTMTEAAKKPSSSGVTQSYLLETAALHDNYFWSLCPIITFIFPGHNQKKNSEKHGY